MKLYLLLTFLASFGLHAETPSAIAGDGIGDTQPESVAYGQAVESEEGGMLAKLRETSPVKEHYESCINDKQPDIGDCVWQRVKEAGQEADVLQLVEYAQEAEGRNPAQEQEKKQFEGVSLVNSKRTKLDPVDEKVQKFFQKKILDGLYGDDQDKKKYLVKHDNFYSLYKSRLTKNILEAVSAFCVEALPVDMGGATAFIIPQAKDDPAKSVILRKYARKWNIENMKHSPVNQESGKNENVASSVWSSCLLNIDKICTQKLYKCDDAKKPKSMAECQKKSSISISESNFPSGGSSIMHSKHQNNGVSESVSTALSRLYQADKGNGVSLPGVDKKASFTETMGKACQVSQYLKGARQSLTALETIDKKMDEKRAGEKVIGYQMEVCNEVSKGKCNNKGEIEAYDSSDKEKGVDSLTTLTSKEAVEESGMKDANKELLEDFKKCRESQDEETCKKYLATNKKEQEAMVHEYDIRSRAVLARIQKLKEEKSKDGLTQFLKEEGYTEDQISAMTESDESVEKLWKTVEEKYANARKNLVASMNKRLKGTTTNKDDSVTFSGQEADTGAIENIQAELTDKTERYADLVHFNNIVSGYLQVGEGENAKRNTASLFAETEASGGDSASKITEAAGQAGISDSRDDENSDPASLDTNQINENILNHIVE